MKTQKKQQQKATICNKTIVDYQPFSNKKNENNTNTINPSGSIVTIEKTSRKLSITINT